MIIRALKKSDVEKLKRIHDDFYKDQFEFPDFFDKYLCAFAVIENDKVISAGGVRALAESVIITDKEESPRVRMDALEEILNVSKYTCNKFGFNQLHAFIQDERWLRQLKRNGFEDCKGSAIFTNF